MRKPSVYLDTTIISSYWYYSSDVVALSRRFTTRDWWTNERPNFDVYVSVATESELAAGNYRNQANCLRMCRRLSYKSISGEVRELAGRLLSLQIVPENKPGDALQIAVAISHQIDYLLTWNYAHLANPVVQSKLASMCERLNLRMSWMVSPDSIPKAQLGEFIRRPR
jgi:hypothetical protein